MRRVRIDSQAEVDAAPAEVHERVADYRRTRIRLWPPTLRDHGLHILSGGSGAGTVYRHIIHLGLREATVRTAVEEPVPGLVLIDRNLDLPLTTTWTFTPALGGHRTRVMLETEWTPPSGLSGVVQRVMAPRQLRSVHRHALDGLVALFAPSQGDVDG